MMITEVEMHELFSFLNFFAWLLFDLIIFASIFFILHFNILITHRCENMQKTHFLLMPKNLHILKRCKKAAHPIAPYQTLYATAFSLRTSFLVICLTKTVKNIPMQNNAIGNKKSIKILPDGFVSTRDGKFWTG